MKQFILIIIAVLSISACNGSNGTSIESDGAYIKLKSGEFIKLYSASNPVETLEVDHSSWRGFRTRLNEKPYAVSGSSFEDIFQSVKKADFDSFLLLDFKFISFFIIVAIAIILLYMAKKKLRDENTKSGVLDYLLFLFIYPIIVNAILVIAFIKYILGSKPKW